MKQKMKTVACSIILVLGFSSVALGQESGGDLRSAVQNPVASLYSLPFKFIFDNGATNGNANFLNIQPVLPVTVGDWNLVNRIIAPIIDAPGGVPGLPPIPTPSPGPRATGLGDINYSLFFSPVKYDEVIWGVGPSVSMPTASETQLGSGKWSIGPTAVVLLQPKWGTWGVLGRHIWSVAGDSARADVNQTLIEPFLSYNLDKGWYLTTDLIITANWQATSGNEWTVPLGGGVGRVMKWGSQPVNLRGEYYYNVVKPTGAPEWQMSFTVSFLFPKT
jgi:hypothetical protein